MKQKRIGRQTPTLGKTLPYKHTKGPEAVDLYNRTGRTAMEWQASLIYDIMGLDEDEMWTHSRFGLSVPRQNGKNEVTAIRELWGLLHGERMLHTAHRSSTSRAAWRRLIALLDGLGITEKPVNAKEAQGYRAGKSKGQENILMDPELGGGSIEFRTRTTTNAIGESFDLVVIDEAQEYQPEHASALKYTISASLNPQLIYTGTPPTLYSSGVLFPQYRKNVLLDGQKRAGWAEWSVDENPRDLKDKELWYETNPSLGITISERTIEDELIESDPIDFAVQRLGLWLTYSQQSAISRPDWEALAVTTLPELVGKLGIGVKFAKDGGSCSMSLAVKTADGHKFVECLGCHPMRDGLDWLLLMFKSTAGQYLKVVVDGANGYEMLAKAMKNAGLPAPYAPTTKDYIDANALFEQDVFQKNLQHMQQPAVVQVVTNCAKRPIGSSGGFGFKSQSLDYDISIMDSLILASWCVDAFKPAEGRRKTVRY